MVEVYGIVSLANGEIYVGMALNAEKRLKEHNNGKNRYTKGLRPWKIIHIEYFSDWKQARVREKFLKSGVGKEFLKSMVP
jgi:putative endonuclease